MDSQVEKKPAAKQTVHKMDETIAQDCQSDTDSGFVGDDEDVPSSIGRYEIDRLLGRGGMGSVYLARDTNLQREVALKVPKFSSETNPLSIERFYREARSAANLSHPNLCPVFDVGEIDGTHYIAMAYIKGRPLSYYAQPDKLPDARVAALIIRKVALAMEDAHKSGILHRDLKPANIMIDHRKEPIVMDFGLACPQDTGAETRLTVEGTLLGSPAYMPPEQLTGRTEQIGPTSDVYSLGVVLYELLTGRLPFEGVESTIALIGRILSEPSKDVTEARPDVDKGLAAVCRKAMAKDVADRYPSMKAFAKDLANYLRSDGKNETITLAEPKPTSDATTIRLEEQTKLVKTLCKTGQLEAASQILDEIVANPAAKDSEAGQWATSMIPKVQSRLTKQMSVAKTRSVKPRPQVKAQPLADDPFANLPSAVAPTANAPFATPTQAYKRPQRGKPASSKPRWIMPAVIGAVSLGVLGLGGFAWMNRQTGTPLSPTADTAESTETLQDTQASTPSANRRKSNAAETSEPDPTESRPRGPGRNRFGDGNRGQRRDPPIRAEELLDLDTDGDGKVKLSQLDDNLRRIVRFADSNNDGALDRSEINEMERRRPRPGDGFDEGPGPPDDRPFQRGGPGNGPRGRDDFEPGPRGPRS